MSEEKTPAPDTTAGDVVKPPRRKMGFKQKFLLIVTSLLLMAFLRTGFLFVIIALLPAIVTHYLDLSKHRYSFRTVFACNLAGALPYIGQMLHAGPSSALLHGLMGSAATWFVIYGAALMGWLLVEACPVLAQMMIVGTNEAQINRIERMQKKIESEWGPEVTMTAMDGDDY